MKVVKGGVASTFLDLHDVVQDDGEEGCCRSPSRPTSRPAGCSTSTSPRASGDNRVEELRAPTGDAADPASRRLVLHLPHPDGPTNHNGGQLQFGPDGMLYARARRRRRARQRAGPRQPARQGPAARPARRRRRLLHRPGRQPVRRPTAGTRALVWASGLRNPFRFSFDRATGDLDRRRRRRGHDGGDRLAAGGKRRRRAARTSAGRPARAASRPARGRRPCALAGSVTPILDLFHDDGYVALIAGYVVRDPSLPSLFGRVIWGDNGKPELSSAVPADARATAAQTGLSIPGLTSFGEDAGGCLYATAGGGTVYRIVENDTRVPCRADGPARHRRHADPADRRRWDDDAADDEIADDEKIAADPGRARPHRRGPSGCCATAASSCGCAAAWPRARPSAATLQIGRRKLELRRAATRARAGRTVTLKARLTPTARRLLTAALRRGAQSEGRRPRPPHRRQPRRRPSCASPSAPAADRIP